MVSYRLRARLTTIYNEFFDFFAESSVLDLAAGVIIGNAFEVPSAFSTCGLHTDAHSGAHNIPRERRGVRTTCAYTL